MTFPRDYEHQRRSVCSLHFANRIVSSRHPINSAWLKLVDDEVFANKSAAVRTTAAEKILEKVVMKRDS